MNWFSCNITPEEYAALCPEGFCSVSCFPIGTVVLSVLVIGLLVYLGIKYKNYTEQPY